jgi:CBS domain-containing protein
MPNAPTTATRLTLVAETAEELMSPNPVSIPDDAPLAEAVAVLTDRGFSAAPVIDEAGRPVGVISRADILIHERERLSCSVPAPAGPAGPGGTCTDPTLVRDIMTPAIFSITPETEARKVIAEMLALKVHHLFVVDATGILVGVISPLDVLRRLR